MFCIFLWKCLEYVMAWSSTRASTIDLCFYGLKNVSKITNSVVSMKKSYTSAIIFLRNIKSFLLWYLSLVNYMLPCHSSIYSWSDNKWLAIKWILWFLSYCQLMIVGLKQQRFLWYCVISTAPDCAEGKKNAPFHSGIIQKLIRAA